jgi:hypothetical protein
MGKRYEVLGCTIDRALNELVLLEMMLETIVKGRLTPFVAI